MSLRIILLWCVLLSATRVAAQDKWLSTAEVRGVVEFDGAVWVASAGGIERYALPALERTHHFTQAQGLDSLDVLALEVVNHHMLIARTPRSRCALSTNGALCEKTLAALPAPTLFARSWQGARVSAELPLAQGTLLGTSGAGLWLENKGQTRRITPQGQICGNHVQALSVFKDELWIGTFRNGLCVQRAAGFVSVPAPFRYVNALLAVEGTLYVAAHEGLFYTRDGVTFEVVKQVNERGVNGLAREGDTLFVTTPATLYQVPLSRGALRIVRHPGGSSALQGVSVQRGEVWLSSEDRGALHLRGKQVEVFDALRGLASSWVVDVTVDARGTAYAATLKDGLFAISPKGDIERRAAPSAWLLKLGFLEGTLWVGSQDGLFTRSAPELTLEGASVHALAAHRDRVWVGTEGGLFSIAPQALSRGKT